MCIYCPSLLNAGSAPVLVYLELHDQGLKNFPKCTGPGPMSTRNLLVLNMGMEEIKFVEHKINLPPSPLPGSSN